MRFYRVILDGADPLRQPRGLTMKREIMTHIVEFDKKKALENFSRGFEQFTYRNKIKPIEVAKDFGLTHAAVSAWKNGKGFPDFQTLYKLFCMGMTIREVFGDEIEKTERMNRLIVETEEMKKSFFSLLQNQDEQSSENEALLKAQIIENEKEIAQLNEECIRLSEKLKQAKAIQSAKG